VELVEVHGVFERLGFREVMRTTHEGFVRPTAVTFRKMVQDEQIRGKTLRFE
jgi:hypothetical protein